MKDYKLINFLDADYELCLETLNWRNNPNVSKHFIIQNIDIETHKKWLQSMKEENPKTIAFLIKNDEKYIGVTYFSSINYEEKSAEWGIYIANTDDRGKGGGKFALQKSLDYAKELKLKKIYLRVLKNNEKVIKLYEKFGFEKEINLSNNIIKYKKLL